MSGDLTTVRLRVLGETDDAIACETDDLKFVLLPRNSTTIYPSIITGFACIDVPVHLCVELGLRPLDPADYDRYEDIRVAVARGSLPDVRYLPDLESRGVYLHRVEAPQHSLLTDDAQLSSGPLVFYSVVDASSSLHAKIDMVWLVAGRRAGIARGEHSIVWLEADSPEHAVFIWLTV